MIYLCLYYFIVVPITKQLDLKSPVFILYQLVAIKILYLFNPLIAKLFNCNLHPLMMRHKASRCYTDLSIWRPRHVLL